MVTYGSRWQALRKQALPAVNGMASAETLAGTLAGVSAEPYNVSSNHEAWILAKY